MPNAIVTHLLTQPNISKSDPFPRPHKAKHDAIQFSLYPDLWSGKMNYFIYHSKPNRQTHHRESFACGLLTAVGVLVSSQLSAAELGCSCFRYTRTHAVLLLPWQMFLFSFHVWDIWTEREILQGTNCTLLVGQAKRTKRACHQILFKYTSVDVVSKVHVCPHIKQDGYLSHEPLY